MVIATPSLSIGEIHQICYQGRNPTLMDITIAIADPVFLLAGPLGPDDALKVVGKKSLEAAGKKPAGRAITAALENAAQRQATRQLGETVPQLAGKDLAPWLLL